ncbi:serine protease [Lentzea sp. NBRC 105346]|uniref:S1 family peptidase n=1 Tax=Lentzea sp. NBRC 105346 TaxID=3032205 RepID=UPI0024A2B5E1|nr:S1 family peptidase [Lentzea sp. NBRC 105346]GLZ32805.1 serine protease [Lentzea sp. NBRC 105346]
MNRTSAARLTGAVLLATGVVTALSVPAFADPAAPAGATSSNTESYPSELLQAVQRDLGLNADQARVRLASDERSGSIENSAKSQLGEAFGGAWIDQSSGKLQIASTKPGVTVDGADVRTVKYSQQQLNGTKTVLDVLKAPSSVTSWRVDDQTNSVVVEVNKTQRDAATEAFLKTVRSISPAVQVAEVTESPTPLYDLRGGDAVYMGGGRCSLGFSVQGGFVIAGHCGRAGTATQGYNRVSQGTFAASVFPGNDYAWVRTNSNWTPRPWVNHYGGANVIVKGSTVAAIGATICRSGSTTGWRCGRVQAYNQTVNYAQGQVRGLTKTSACAEPGDSGGSWVAGTGFGQAQGVTSGGSGNCTSGGTTYFQPVNPILQRYGLRLVTG